MISSLPPFPFASARPPGLAETPPTGYESPQQAQDSGWLGQVPPSSGTTPPPPVAQPPTYAVPELAPDPWFGPPTVPGTDPTLFG